MIILVIKNAKMNNVLENVNMIKKNSMINIFVRKLDVFINVNCVIIDVYFRIIFIMN